MDMLNLVLPLKQDQQSQAALQQLVGGFAEQGQPLIGGMADQSQIIHSARIILVDNKYLQVLTVFDGDFFDYTEFFRVQLGPVFQAIFQLGLIEGAPTWDEVNTPNAWYQFTRDHNAKALGSSPDGDPNRGYLYSAFGDTTVREIHAALARARTSDAPPPGPSEAPEPGPPASPPAPPASEEA